MLLRGSTGHRQKGNEYGTDHPSRLLTVQDGEGRADHEKLSLLHWALRHPAQPAPWECRETEVSLKGPPTQAGCAPCVQPLTPVAPGMNSRLSASERKGSGSHWGSNTSRDDWTLRRRDRPPASPAVLGATDLMSGSRGEEDAGLCARRPIAAHAALAVCRSPMAA